MNNKTVFVRKRSNDKFLGFLKGEIVLLRKKKFNTEPVAQTQESTISVTRAQPDRSSLSVVLPKRRRNGISARLLFVSASRFPEPGLPVNSLLFVPPSSPGHWARVSS
jgi:hypothetical protein